MLSVSIVTYQTPAEELCRCLDSLDTSTVDRIYVVDNGRRVETEELCRKNPKIEYIGNDNIGYGAAHNIAIRKAMEEGSDYHLVLNPDVYFSPEILVEILAFMDQNPDVGQLQPKLVYPDGNLQMTVRRLPTPRDLIFRRFLPTGWNNKRDRRYTLSDWDHADPLDVPYHQGSFMFFRVDALREVGLFDERFFMYPEDIDLTRRMHAKYRTLYWPKVEAVHCHRAQSYHDRRLLKIHLVNMIRYFNKWGWFFDGERRRLNRKLMDNLKGLNETGAKNGGGNPQ